MHNKKKFISIAILIACMFFACVSSEEKIKIPSDSKPIENTMSNTALLSFQDSFDIPRPDLWDFAQLTYNKNQLENFKRATITYSDGAMSIKTTKNSFSKVGYESKFTLQGDFDIQIKCKAIFKKGLKGIDQRAVFSISERNQNAYLADFAWIQLLKKSKNTKITFDAAHSLNKKFKYDKIITGSDFDGYLRFVRKGTTLVTQIKDLQESQWTKLAKVKFTDNDMKIVFYGSNFTGKLKKISTDKSFQVKFDDFKIVNAQGIEESDI